MDGIINILKPPGMTSNNVVSDVRRLLGVKKAGHAGTLDPGAAGVLAVCVGKATKLFGILMEKDKRYIAQVNFGIRTDTQDSYGRIVEQRQCSVSPAEFERAAQAFVGKQMQTPSSFSAIKIGGRKAYQLARKGEQIDLSSRSREIEIYSIKVLEQLETGFLIEVHCTKGTYIRQLAEQIGASLGLPSYLAFLLRTASGDFKLEDSYTISQIERMKSRGDCSFLKPVDEAMNGYARAEVAPEFKKRLMNGNSVQTSLYNCDKCLVYCNGVFFGIGSISDGLLQMRVMLHGGPDEKKC